MTADSWDVCPACYAEALSTYQSERQFMLDQYGVVPMEEFERMKRELGDPPDPDDFHTFKEYHEFWGADVGQIKYRYDGGCTECDAECKFDGEAESFWPTPRQEEQA